MQLVLDQKHGLVLGTAVLGIAVVNGWMSFRVGKARKQYKVPYPTMYADPKTITDADAFNCVQRGHQNTLENLPAFLTLLLTSGVEYPEAASVAGLVWIVGRIAYFQGYSSGDPKARYRGGFNHIGMLALLGMSGAFAVQLMLGKTK